MKNIKQLLGIVLTTIIFLVSCSKEDNISDVKTVQLKFQKDIHEKSKKSGESIKNLDFFSYIVKVNTSGQLSVNDDELIVDEAINQDTGIKSYVITQRGNNKTTLKALQLSARANFESGGGGFERGYFFDGECFVYGTMYYGDNGVNLFVPCGINCVGFDDVCPEWNEGFA